MGQPVGPACSSGSYDYTSSDSTTVATVQLGETNLTQVASRLKIDPDDLLLANPQIKDPSKLSPGQALQLPVDEDATCSAGSSNSSENGQSTKFAGTRPQVSDPLYANLIKTQLQAKQTASTPPDEQIIRASFGEAGLRAYQDAKKERAEYDKLPVDEQMVVDLSGKGQLAAYQQQKREVRDEFVQARHIYETTGKVPPNLKHFAPIEIEKGHTMSRSERYDEMLKKHGMDHAELGDIEDDHRDPKYLSQDEYKAEFWQREHQEFAQCEKDNIRPGTIDKCQRGVDEKYGGEGFKEWRDEQEMNAAANYRVYQNKVDDLASSGAVSLAGRVVGRTIGYIANGDKGADKGEEIGAAIGGLGDGFAGTYADKGQIATTTTGNHGDRMVETSNTFETTGKHESETKPTETGGTPPPTGGAGGTGATGAGSTPPPVPSASPREFVDTNTARTLDDARHKEAKGETLSTQEKRVLDQYRGKDVWVSHSTDTELNFRGDGTKKDINVATDTKPSTQPERAAILKNLQDAGVGGGDTKGEKDRMLVRQVLLTPAPAGKTNTFATNDKGVVNGMFRLAKIPDPQRPGQTLDPAKLGMSVSDYLHNVLKQDTFDVTVEGHRLTVKPT
jgi:hypothetical protein